MDIKEAKKSGAKALFGEKYSNIVRVVQIGKNSIELCGGTHVKNSAEIGLFVIAKESGVSAGVRRIEALCSLSAYHYLKNIQKENEKVAKDLKNKDLIQGIKKLKDEIKELKNELILVARSQNKELKESEIKGVKVIIDEVKAGDIKKIIDEKKAKYEKVAIMLFQVKNQKVLIAAGDKGANIHCGQWVKEIAAFLGGGGGGRADFASAGGKDIAKLKEAQQKAMEFVEANIK